MKRVAWVLCVVAAVAVAEEPLEPVVVAATDIAAGEKVTFERISQRSVPKRLVSASHVKPDSASYVVNQTTRVPLLAGQVLMWGYFETTSGETDKACREALKSGSNAKQQVAAARTAVRKK